MHLLNTTKRLVKKSISGIAKTISPIRWKEYNELRYWKKVKSTEERMSNDHYEYFYTTHFGLDRSFYENKVLLDIGCGPRGSLEWASMASSRIGLDPLAKEYLRLGAIHHQMEYIDSPSENIPLKEAECDAVFSFNSLDHVEDVGQTISEIKRVTSPGGIVLLLIEVNHSPTDCEPHQLTPKQLVDSLAPEFHYEDLQVYLPVASGIYQSIRADKKLPDPLVTNKIGYFSARFIRSTSPAGKSLN